MSRTDAHVPFWVRLARGDVPRAEAHHHPDGLCDLPDPWDRDALRWLPGGCSWQWHDDGRGVCPCEICHGGVRHRAERRADRQSANRALRVAVDLWNAGRREDVDRW